MATKPELKIIGTLDKKATQKAIQNQLNEISKNLKLTIGASSQSISKQAQVDAKQVKTAYITTWKEIDARKAELDIKLAKSFEKVETARRKSETAQQKAIDKTNKEQEREIALVERYTKKIQDLQDRSSRDATALNKYKLTSEEKTDLNTYLKDIQQLGDLSGKNSTELRKMADGADTSAKRIRNLGTEVKASGRSALKFSEYLGNAFKAFSLWSVVTVGWYAAINQLKDLVGEVKQLDDALLELSKTSDLSTNQLQAFAEQASKVGKSINESAANIVMASAEFSRMGFSPEESLRLAEDAVVLTKVSEGIQDVSTASTALIAIIKGFNVPAEESRSILDKINEVSNNFSVSSSDLTDGLRRVGAVMKQNNVSIDESIGLLVGAQQGLQNIEKVSSGIITISTRLNRVSESIEDVNGLTVKLGDAFEAYTQGRVKLENMDGSLRSTYDILVDLAGIWDTLDDKSQAYLGFLSSGQRQSPVFNQIMSDLQGTIDATATSIESAGSATEELEKVMGSLQGKLDKAGATWSRISTDFLSSKTTGNVLDLANGVLELVEDLGLLNTVLLGSIPLLIKFKDTMAVTQLVGFVSSLLTLNPILLMIAGTTAVVTASYLDYNKQQQDLIDNIAVSNESLKSQAENWDKLDESQKKALETQAKQTILDTAGKLDKAHDSVKKYTKELNYLEEEYNSLQDRILNGEKLQSNEMNRFESLGFIVDKYKNKINESNNIIEANATATAILNGQYDMLHFKIPEVEKDNDDLNDSQHKVLTSTELLQKAMDELSSQGKLSGETYLQLIELFPDLVDEFGVTDEAIEIHKKNFANMTDDQIRLQRLLTEETIKNVIDRIKTYKTELESLSRVINSSIGTDFEQAFAERKYIGISSSIDKDVESLQDLRAQVSALDSLSSKTAKTDKIDILKQFKDEQNAIKSITDEIDNLTTAIQRSEGQDRIDKMNELIKLYEEQQEAVHNYAESMRALDKSGLNEDELETINNAIIEQGKSWNNLETQIYSTGKQIKSLNEEALEKLKKSTKDYYGELSDAVKDDLKEYKEAQKEKKDSAVQALKDEIEEKKELLEDLNREESEDDYLAKKEEITDAIEQLEQESANLRYSTSLRDKQRRFEIAEELADLETELSELKSDRELELQEEAINDQIDNLESQIDDEESAYDKRIELAEEYYENLIDKIDSFEDRWGDVGLNAGESFVSSFESELNKLIEDINEATGSNIEKADSSKNKPSSSSSKKSSSTGRDRVISAGETSKDVIVSESEIVVLEDEKGNTFEVHRNTYNKDKDRLASMGYTKVGSAATGASVLSDGLAYVHKDEEIVPSSLASEIGSKIANISNYGADKMGDFVKGMSSGRMIPDINSNTSNSSETQIGNLINIESLNIPDSNESTIRQTSASLARSVQQELSRKGKNLIL